MVRLLLLLGLAGGALAVVGPGTSGHAAENTLVTPQLISKPVVVSSSYSTLSKGHQATGWSTSVVFFVHNPSSKLVGNVQYRVTLFSAQGRQIHVSGGDDTFGLDRSETRPIVFEADVIGIRPRSAKIRIYSAESGGPFASVRWQFSNAGIFCDQGLVECEVKADLTLRSKTPAEVFSVTAIVRRRTTGAIVAAGTEGLGRELQPNQTIPIHLYVNGRSDADKERTAAFKVQLWG